MRRSSSTRTGLSSLGSILKQSLDALGLHQKVAEQQAAAKWAEVVGPQIAAVTLVEKVQDGVMFVVCKNSMWANELTLHTQEILKKLTCALGRESIKDIRLSARGFHKARAQARSAEQCFDIDRIELNESEKAAAGAAASGTSSEELAERIRKAVLAGKKRERLIKENQRRAS